MLGMEGFMYLHLWDMFNYRACMIWFQVHVHIWDRGVLACIIMHKYSHVLMKFWMNASALSEYMKALAHGC
jgi:hypothetical protein